MVIGNRKWLSFITAIAIVIQFVLGGLTAKPVTVAAAANGPVITSISPSASATNVPTNARLIITFDENVRKGTGSATLQIRKQLDNSIFESYVVATDNKVSLGTGTNRNVVTISPSTSFALNTSYYVTIDAGAFVNEGNNANYAGLTNAVSWSFTTIAAADTTPPVLSATAPLTPANGGSTSIITTLTMNFSEPVYATNGNITVTNTAQSADTQSISVNSQNVSGSSTTSVTISLPNVLRGNSTYEVIVPSGVFQDASGNNFAGVAATQWRFTTTAPPLGTPTLQPANGAFAVSVASKLTLSFPSTVSANRGSIYIKKIADNSTVQTIPVTSTQVAYTPITGTDNTVSTDVVITPTELPASTGLYILIDTGAFRDTTDATILYQGISDARTWTFTTDPGNDRTPPTLLPERKPLTTQATPTINLEMNFSKPVYQGTGTITIRSLPSGAVFASIPVTSANVSGGGTSKITVIDTTKTYVNNTTYYVEISGQAFADAKGNYFAGISGSSAWSFIVTQDTTKPTLILQSPPNLAVDVPTQAAKFEATFSKPIMLGTNPAAINVKRISGTGNSPVATTFSVDPTNNRKLLISVTGTMAVNTDYYMEIAAGAVTDLAGNQFDGILNQYQWTFRTANTATGAPTVNKAELTNAVKIAITFNKALDTSAAATPLPANFFVTVNGTGRAVSDVSVSGQVVSLTLQGSSAAGQTIKVSYSAGTNPIRDLNGVVAANFSNVNVTSVPDTTPPYQVSGSINGNVVVLTFNKDLATVNAAAYSQFTVNINGSSRSVTEIAGSGTLLLLTFSGATAPAGQPVYVSYYASSYPIRDLSGNALSSFSSFYIQNGQDIKAAKLINATASGTQVALNFDQSLNPSLVPPVSAFRVTGNGSSRTISKVTVSGGQVLLTVSPSFTTGDAVLVSYVIGSPPLMDLSGNSVPAFSNIAATNTGTSSLGLYGIIAKGSTVTLNFSATLNPGNPASSSQFTVKVNNTVRPISNITTNGSAVILTLYTPIGIGDNVKVSYNNNGAGPRSTTGDLPASFTDANAANQTTWADNAGGDYEAADGGGIGIKTSAASTVSAVTPAGINVKQYVLASDKLANAFSLLTSVNGVDQRVVFTVPSTEYGASVAFPLGVLDNAKRSNPNASIVVAYQTVTFEVPLSALNFTGLAQQVNAVGGAGQLIFSIDTNAGALATALNTQIRNTGAKTLVSPMSFQLDVTNNGQSKAVESFSGYVTRTIKTNLSTDGRQAAVVWLDPQTGNLSYVPTQVTQVNGQSLITFKRKGNSVYAVVKGATNFVDLNKHWAQNDILLLANKYIVEGSTLTSFAPNKAITRGEFALFIAKGLGLSGDRTAAAKFKDINTSTTLAAYIGAAATSGIVQGFSDGTFRPNNPVTREEMASMIIRAAGAAGVQVSLSGTAADLLKRFADRGQIGTWAQSDVAKAIQAGIINGQTPTSFGGKKNATRAEATIMVKRLLAYIKFLDI